jgi:transposase-like protein
MPVIEEWQSRGLEKVYIMVYLDCIHVKLRKDGKVRNTAIYTALGVDKEGKKHILGHWIGDGGEGSNYWLSVITDIKNRGTEDILICAVDGLKGFKEAIQSVYPDCIVQRCIIHQIRNSFKYVSWKDKKEFVKDLKTVYKAATLDEAEDNLLRLSDKWSNKYLLSVKSWEDNWEDLSQYFQFTPEIRRLVYTTNIIEGYYRQIRKVIKNKGVFPTKDSVRKMFFLATRDIIRKWTRPITNWPKIMNQLAIKFEGRIDYG